MKFENEEIELLTKLCSLNGISGREDEIRDYLKIEYKKLGFDYFIDNLGNIFAIKKSKNPNAKKVVIEGHMDEVGLMVTSIRDDGYVLATEVGGLYFSAMVCSLLQLKTNKGDYIYGTIEAKAQENLGYYVCNFGFDNKNEAIAAGVQGGDMIVAQGEVKIINGGEKLLGKAFDDRFGIALGLQTLKHFKDIDLPFDLYIGGTVQEEVGTRGAYVLAENIKPDLVISLDTGFAKAENENNGIISKGVLIRHIDGGMVSFKKLIDLQIEALNNVNMPYQDYYRTRGGTNAGAIHKTYKGVHCLTHCITGLNIHTPLSFISATDYYAAKDSLFEIIRLLSVDNRLEKVLSYEND